MVYLKAFRGTTANALAAEKVIDGLTATVVHVPVVPLRVRQVAGEGFGIHVGATGFEPALYRF